MGGHRSELGSAIPLHWAHRALLSKPISFVAQAYGLVLHFAPPYANHRAGFVLL